MNKILSFIGLTILASGLACNPYIDPDIPIGPLPAAPAFSVEVLPNDPNRVVIRDLSDGYFSRLWSMPGGSPNRSTALLDTVLYTRAGSYEITLHAAKEGGGGTATATQSITITQDLQIDCDSTQALLTGDCGSAGKQWTFSQEAGAITVGPNPYSSDWFSSTPGSLDPEQYNDIYTFFFDGNVFQYENNGLTVDPCDGYQALPYNSPANITWTFTPGAGLNGEDRITLPDGVFIGVRDSGPFYDILTLTETELVLHGPLKPCSPGTEGWFTLKFVKAN